MYPLGSVYATHWSPVWLLFRTGTIVRKRAYVFSCQEGNSPITILPSKRQSRSIKASQLTVSSNSLQPQCWSQSSLFAEEVKVWMLCRLWFCNRLSVTRMFMVLCHYLLLLFYSLDRTKFVKNAWRTIRFAQLQTLEKENARQQNNRNKIRRQNENCKNLLCAALIIINEWMNVYQ